MENTLDDISPWAKVGNEEESSPTGDRSPWAEPEPSTVLGEIPRGLKAGVQQLRGMGYGLGALAGKVVESEGLKDWAKEGLADVESKTPKPAVGSVKDIESASDLGKYLSYGISTNLPNMLLSLTGGGLGAVAGKTLVGQATKEATKQAITRGALAGAGVSSLGMEAGSIASDQLTETGEVSPLRAMAGAIPAAMLDVVPEWYLAKRLGWLGDASKLTGGRLSRAGKVAAGQFAMEAPTEAMQSVLERAAVPGKSITNAEAWDEYINSFILGGATGGVVGGIGGVFTKTAQNKTLETPTQTVLSDDPIAKDIETRLSEADPEGLTKAPEGMFGMRADKPVTPPAPANFGIRGGENVELPPTTPTTPPAPVTPPVAPAPSSVTPPVIPPASGWYSDMKVSAKESLRPKGYGTSRKGKTARNIGFGKGNFEVVEREGRWFPEKKASLEEVTKGEKVEIPTPEEVKVEEIPTPVAIEPEAMAEAKRLWEGKAYRAETGYTHEKTQTAADVIRFEQEELGNKLGVTPKVISELENRPATDVVWVTKTKKATERYGGGTLHELPANSTILAEDGDGGYLVLRGEVPVEQPKTPRTTQPSVRTAPKRPRGPQSIFGILRKDPVDFKASGYNIKELEQDIGWDKFVKIHRKGKMTVDERLQEIKADHPGMIPVHMTADEFVEMLKGSKGKVATTEAAKSDEEIYLDEHGGKVIEEEIANMKEKEEENARILAEEKVDEGEGDAEFNPNQLERSKEPAPVHPKESTPLNTILEQVKKLTPEQAKEVSKVIKPQASMPSATMNFGRTDHSPGTDAILDQYETWRKESRNQALSPQSIVDAYEKAVGKPLPYAWMVPMLDKYGVTFTFDASKLVYRNTAAAAYDRKGNFIVYGDKLNLFGDIKHAYGELFAHEGLHAIIENELKARSQVGVELKSKLLKFAEELKPHFNNASGWVQQNLETIKYREPTELITLAFTNKQFAQWLDSIKVKGEAKPALTMWGKLKNIIATVINKIPGVKTKLDELHEIMDSVLTIEVPKATKTTEATGNLPGLSFEETFELTPKGEVGGKPEYRKPPPTQGQLFTPAQPAPPFYSQLIKTVATKLKEMPSKVQSILSWLQKNQVKPEELKWMGVEQWIKDNSKDGIVGRAKFLEFLKSNNIEMEEVTKGKKTISPQEWEQLPRRAQRLLAQYGDGYIPADEFYNEMKSLGFDQTEASVLLQKTLTDETKFSTYQLPGGENYREMLLRLPGKGGYSSAHWDEPNVLGHVRMNDRVDSEGNRVLFLEEVQSDWHQEGKEKGYKGQQTDTEIEAENKRIDEYAIENYGKDYDSLPTIAQNQIISDLKIGEENKVSPAPFAKSWHELLMKRMLRYAAENGYDKLAWTTGEQQAERYDLAKQIDTVRIAKYSNGLYDITAKKDGKVLIQKGDIAPDKLADYIGKDLANKSVNDLANKQVGKMDYSGLDLKVGGEGMAVFYDKLIPGFMDKYVKQWGSKVGKTEIGTLNQTMNADVVRAENNIRSQAGEPLLKKTTTVHSVPITPSMSASVIHTGQQLFLPLSDTMKRTIGTMESTFTRNPQNMPKELINKLIKEVETLQKSDLKWYDSSLSVPFAMSQKYTQWKEMWKIHGIERVEKRSSLRSEHVGYADEYFTIDKRLKKAGLNKAERKEAKSRVVRMVFATDIMLHDELVGLKEEAKEATGARVDEIQARINEITTLRRYSDAQLQNGIVDEYGNTIKLNSPTEIAAYTAVRKSMDKMMEAKIDWLHIMAFRKWKDQKWYNLILQASGLDLSKEAVQTLVGREGLNSAAINYAKKINVDIGNIFDRINKVLDEPTTTELYTNELVDVAEKYKKIADKVQEDLTSFQNYLGKVTNITDKEKLSKLTREVFTAYMQTRPYLKQIRTLRNQMNDWVGYAPRTREQGKFKARLVEQIFDDETGALVREESRYSVMFNKKSEYPQIYQTIMDKYAKNGNLPPNHLILAEAVTVTPEMAFQGVNDINTQKIIDDAITNMSTEGDFYDKAGNKIDIHEQLQESAYQAIANQFMTRGAGRSKIHRKQGEAIKGYDEENLDRVLLGYISSMTGLMTKQLAAADAIDLLKGEKNKSMFEGLSKYNSEMLRNDSMGDKISGRVRSYAFIWFLGGLLKSAAINLTQNPIVGFAELSKYMREHGIKGVGDVEYSKALKDVLIGKLSPQEKQLINQLITSGIAQDQYIQSIFEGLGSRQAQAYDTVARWLATPFSMTEVYNRKSAGVAIFRQAYPMYLKQGLSEEKAYNKAFADTRTFIDNVHYAYGKTNRPLFMQSGDFSSQLMHTAYTFRGFTHNFLVRQATILSQGDWRTFVKTMAYIGVLGGLMALPFFKDFFEWIEKQYGYSATKVIRKSLRGVGGETLETFGMNGLPALLGANISGSLATGLPWPIGADNMEDTIFGVYGGLLQKGKRAGEAFGRKDYMRGLTEISPEVIRNPMVAARESQFGKETFGTPGFATTTRGRVMYDEEGKPLRIKGHEVALKTIGLNPAKSSREREMEQTIKRQESWASEQKRDAGEEYRIARLRGDKNALSDMMKRVKEINQGIKSRGIERLVPPATVAKIIQSSKESKTKQQMKEQRYKAGEL